jgi:hypothetical protein
MRLRFIGANGSMGLTNGKVYEVQVNSVEKLYLGCNFGLEFSEKTFGTWKCPYSSPESFAANWENGC